jgi:5-methylcytosine-specific restriction endonuclease McrA
MSGNDLPAPGSDELRQLLTREDLRSLYAFLYERRGNPPTMVEIREHAATENGESHSQTDRRVRELRGWFKLPAMRSGRVHVYRLEGRADSIRGGRGGISPTVRGEILSAKRCAQCGKTPAEDHVKLEVDHKIPHSWGGTDDIENLQPLCTQCNHDKQAFYSSLDPFEEQIRAATAHMEPHRRIGELLKAFHAAGVDAPSQVVGVVASMHQYQEDWQKRMRELRELGWDYETIKRKENGRMRSYYRLTAFTEWPEGNIAAEIKRRENARKAS